MNNNKIAIMAGLDMRSFDRNNLNHSTNGENINNSRML